MTWDDLDRAAHHAGLMLMGVCHDGDDTIALLGASAAFWPVLRDTPEFRDGAPDPVDRYSTRCVGMLADAHGAEAVFPFGGPPYQPFIRWAKDTGRAWSSPTGMLVHDTAGLMISYRGALRFASRLPLPAARPVSPCDTCAGRPCLEACPVGALSGTAPYDVPACHAFLDTGPGQACMTQGCAVRRTCPVSQAFGRDPAQSALHMTSFHPT